ncbi:hypothetical protein JOY44_26205 (plasmid) [Phormidium sp. CLA17]|uniref:hypothetical protein n=1 Tax=Leptolyngbya sp. Cla-17 TaxID=2803751 RepID=UPI0014910FA2|nr:hypothetical protein [Leptolyngbya sp. Cla-17]MBM0745016.1 hypothetical protein [Leptolyngbya sp. Cla-17]
MTTTLPKIKLTLFQLAVLRQHYKPQQEISTQITPQEDVYGLLEELGKQKLLQAIALIPNNPQLSYEQAGIQLAILDHFHAHPEHFEFLNQKTLNTLNEAPEILYADGEKALITIDRKCYRYEKDTIFD